MSTRIQFQTDGFSLVVCRHPDGRFLAVKETKGRGWWLPAGHVDAGQNFVEAALRETVEEAGLEVNLKGVLAVEHTLCSNTTARMRVIFYAEPADPHAIPKTIPDKESECAAWLSLSHLQGLSDLPLPDGLRGSELIEWGQYINNGGLIAPLFCSQQASFIRYDGFLKLESSGPSASHKAFSTNAHSNSELLPILIEKQWTLLHLAVANDNVQETRSLLLSGSCDINAVTHKRRSALHIAISRKNSEIVRLILLSGGCDIFIKDVDNLSPFDMLSDDNDPKIKTIRKMLQLYAEMC